MGTKKLAEVAQSLKLVNTATSTIEWAQCQQCGKEYRAVLVRDGVCSLCKQAEQDRQERLRAREHWMIQSLGGAKPYRHFTSDQFTATPSNQKALDAILGFDHTSQNLYLWGPCGVGKTHLACIAACHALEHGKSAAVLKPYEFLRRARGKTPEEEQGVIDELVGLDVFVLDELGIGRETEYALQVFYEIVDRRDMSMRSGLIVTSNLALDPLADKLGDDRLTSRLAGLCRVIEIGGADWRPKLRKRKSLEVK